MIELIVVIAIISILATIVIPNVSSMNSKAYTSKVTGNIRNIQTAVDMYALDNDGQYPVAIQPTLEEPQVVNFDVLYPKYLKSIKRIENENYWVDYSGKVWGSTVDAPTDIFTSEKNIEWGNKKDVKEFHVYEIKNKYNQSATNNKKVSLRNKVLTHKTIDKFKMEKEDRDILISAVDQYGLETAPVGPNYFGIGEDWFTPIINKEGTFEFTLNSEELMYWDAFKTVEDKPEGTNIEYQFAILNKDGNYSSFNEDFYSLHPSKSLKVKIIMKGYNGKMPSLYDMRVFYHFAYEEDNYKKPIRITETPEKVVDEYILNIGETIDQIIVTDSYTIGNRPKTIYEYSSDNINYNPIESFIDIPSGNRVRITREGTESKFTTPIIKVYTKPIRIQDAEVPFTPILDEQIPVPKDVEVQDKNWSTVQEIVFVTSAADGQINHWISIDIDDVQPEHTRILYRYATSNGFGWSNFTNDFSKLKDSRLVKIYAVLQIEKNYVNKVDNPEINSIKINSSKGVINLDTVKPTGVIKPIKDNNGQREDISTSSKIKWEYEAYDPQGKEIIEAVWGGDKKDNYNTPGIYTVTLKLRNELNYWSDEIKFTFEVKDEKPIAIIGPTDIDIFTSRHPLNFTTDLSYDSDGDKIIKAEWGGDYKENELYEPGSYTINLRVQDEDGNWSDWVQKNFDTVDSIFFGVGVNALDNNYDTYEDISLRQNMSKTHNITWVEDLTNRTVEMKLSNGHYTATMNISVLDRYGKQLKVLNSISNTYSDTFNIGNETKTLKIKIPEGATQIQIHTQTFAYRSQMFIYEIKAMPESNISIEDLSHISKDASITFNWTNPDISEVERVAIFNNDTYLGNSSNGTFTHNSLKSETEYHYTLVPISADGTIGKEINYTASTIGRSSGIRWFGLNTNAFDHDYSTFTEITLKPNMSKTHTISWEGNLINKTIEMKINKSHATSTMKLYILDKDGNKLKTINSVSNIYSDTFNIGEGISTLKIKIPEGATQIQIHTQTFSYNSRMYIYEIEEKPEKNIDIQNLSHVSKDSSITLNWTNPNTSDMGRVAIFNNNKYLGSSSNGTYTHSTLDSETEYYYTLVPISSDGIIGKKIDYTTSTISRSSGIRWIGLNASAFDHDYLTFTDLTLKPNLSKTHTITWNGNLTNKIVEMKISKSHVTSTMKLYILDKDGNKLETLETISNSYSDIFDLGEGTTTLRLRIPEGAAQIQIHTQTFSYNSRMYIYEIEESN